MTWVKLDDRFFDNVKISALSDSAKIAYLEGLTYCARELTDGFIPLKKAKTIAGKPRIIQELTPHLWEPTAAGFNIHDYLDYNPSKAESLNRKQAISKARSEAGSKGAANRWQNEWQTDSKTHGPVTPIPEGDLNNPLPIPDPDNPPPQPEPPKGLDAVAASFARFGKVTSGTPDAIEYSVKDYSLDWVQRAVRLASAAGFDDRPAWSYVEAILERWKKQGGPDDDKPRVQNGGRNARPVDDDSKYIFGARATAT